MDFIKAFAAPPNLHISHSFSHWLECAVGQVSTILSTALQTCFKLMSKVKVVSHAHRYKLYFISFKELPYNYNVLTYCWCASLISIFNITVWKLEPCTNTPYMYVYTSCDATSQQIVHVILHFWTTNYNGFYINSLN